MLYIAMLCSCIGAPGDLPHEGYDVDEVGFLHYIWMARVVPESIKACLSISVSSVVKQVIFSSVVAFASQRIVQLFVRQRPPCQAAWHAVHGSEAVPFRYSATVMSAIALRSFFADLLDASHDRGHECWLVIMSPQHHRGWDDYIGHISLEDALGERVWAEWVTPVEDLQMVSSESDSDMGDDPDAGFATYLPDPDLFSQSDADDVE
jgi:hypothetical protein